MTRSPRRLREQVRDTVSELPIHAARLAVMGVGRALLLTDRVRKDYREARASGLGPVLGRLKDDAENIAGTVVGKVSGNGTAEEAAKSAAGDSEISIGKPKPAAATRPAASSPRPKPATAPPSRPTATSRPKPAPASKPTPKPAAKPAATSKPTATPKPTTAPKPVPKPAAKPQPAAQAKASPQSKPSPQAKASPQAKPSAEPKATEKPATPAKPRAKGTTAKDLPVTGYDEATLASVRARLRGLDARQVGELRDYERSHAARADFLRMYENRISKLRGDH